MTITSRRAALGLAAVLALGVTNSASAMDPLTLPVDCGRGQTISKALSFPDVPHRPLILAIRGTCNENVTIERDDVMLQGDPASGGTVIGQSTGSAIYVRGANRVRIDRLTVRGSATAINLQGGSNIEISNSDIQFATGQGGGGQGIGVSGASAVSVTNCSVQNNARSGVGAVQASVTITNSQIAANGGNGVRGGSNSSLVVIGSNIHSNAFSGVFLEKSEATINNTSITANGTSTQGPTRNGVSATSSRLQINGGTISSNQSTGIEMQFSQGIISGATITGNGADAGLDLGSKRGISGTSSNVQISNSNISNNPGTGAAGLVGGSLTIYNSTLTGNGEGVLFYLGASGHLGGGAISGNSGSGVSVWINSTVQITAGATIQNNARHGIELMAGSKLWVFEPSITVGGNAWFGLYCNDAESSAANTSLITFSSNGQGGASCTGY